jgi:hypothetical protein
MSGKNPPRGPSPLQKMVSTNTSTPADAEAALAAAALAAAQKANDKDAVSPAKKPAVTKPKVGSQKSKGAFHTPASASASASASAPKSAAAPVVHETPSDLETKSPIEQDNSDVPLGSPAVVPDFVLTLEAALTAQKTELEVAHKAALAAAISTAAAHAKTLNEEKTQLETTLKEATTALAAAEKELKLETVNSAALVEQKTQLETVHAAALVEQKTQLETVHAAALVEQKTQLETVHAAALAELQVKLAQADNQQVKAPWKGTKKMPPTKPVESKSQGTSESATTSAASKRPTVVLKKTMAVKSTSQGTSESSSSQLPLKYSFFENNLGSATTVVEVFKTFLASVQDNKTKIRDLWFHYLGLRFPAKYPKMVSLSEPSGWTGANSAHIKTFLFLIWDLNYRNRDDQFMEDTCHDELYRYFRKKLHVKTKLSSAAKAILAYAKEQKLCCGPY